MLQVDNLSTDLEGHVWPGGHASLCLLEAVAHCNWLDWSSLRCRKKKTSESFYVCISGLFGILLTEIGERGGSGIMK